MDFIHQGDIMKFMNFYRTLREIYSYTHFKLRDQIVKFGVLFNKVTKSKYQRKRFTNISSVRFNLLSLVFITVGSPLNSFPT